MSMKLRVFLSYASDDHLAVANVYNALRVAGFDPWMDQHGLEPGDRWELEIESSLRASDAICVFLSQHALSNQDRYFPREYRLGLEVIANCSPDRSAIIPVRLSPCQAPLELRSFQIVELQDEIGVQRLEVGLRKLAWRFGKLVEPLSEWHSKRARQFLSCGDTSQAVLEADTAVELDPENGDLRLCRAQCYLTQRQFDHALADLGAASRTSTDVFSVEIARAATLRGVGQLDDSVAAAGRAIAMRPADSVAYFVIKKVYSKNIDCLFLFVYYT